MILDTSVLVDILRGDKAAIARIEQLEASGDLLSIPTPVLFELWEGIERADRPDAERRRVQEVLEGYSLMSYDAAHAARGGTISGSLIRRGEMLDPLDVQIAGVALAEGRAVLTRNKKHFSRVPELRVEEY